ncbi:MAG TPA: hypothetical protein DEH24_18655 [Alteromonas sp.]|nr:hypothetical protein [Alteromonas sp.]
MPPVAVGVAAGVGAAAFVSTAVTAVAIGVGAALGTKILTDALTPDLGDYGTDPVADQALTTNANQPRKIIYGESVVGGQIVGVAAPTIGKKEHDIMVVHLAGHPCESVSIYEIEGKTVAELGDAVTMTVYLGNQTTADSTANTYINGWTNDHIGYEQTYVVLKIRRDEELFPRGVNECKFIVRGRKVYDPRKDTTAGGSGAHRPEDSTTWEWSDNPALCAYDYLRHYGENGSLPLRRIPWDFVALTANYCAEQASHTDADGNAATGQRFGCNGALNNGIRPGEGLNNIMATMGAKPYRVGGKIFIKPAMYAGPATVTVDISETNARPLHRPHRPLREITNTVRAEYVAPTKKWQVTAAPTVFSQAYIDKDGSMLATTIRLNMVTKDHQAQRLAKLKLERSRAGFITSYPLPGLRLDIVTGANIRFVSAGSGLNKEFTVEEAKYDASKNVTNLSLIEDAATIYPDNFEPAEGDLTPNTTLPDATAIAAPNTIAFTATPNDDYRQGKLTWDHPTPSSVINYVVLITNAQGTPELTQSFAPIAMEQDLSNLPVGTYFAAVAAKNRFKTSVATQAQFNVGQPNTPVASPTVDLLPGRVIITGPTLPHSQATYEWKFLFEDTFNDALNGGKSDVLTVTNTPHDGTLYVWYRIVDRGVPAPNWLQVVISDLIGIAQQEITPEFIGDMILPESTFSIKDTFSGIAADLQQASNQYSQTSGDNILLGQAVIELNDDLGLVKQDIQSLQHAQSNFDSEITLTNFLNAGFGYEDGNGQWVEGAAFVRAFDEKRIEQPSGSYVSVYEYFELLETRTGNLEGLYQFGIETYNSFTGIEIKNGTNNVSSVRLFMDNLVFAGKDGSVGYQYSATLSRHIWYGARVSIGTNEMIVDDSENPFGPDGLSYWRGTPILDLGEPDLALLTKANADEWRTPDGEWFRKGAATLAGPGLKIVDSNGDPLVEYDAVNDTIKNYGTFYAANIIGGLYGSINKTVTQPTNAVSTTHQVFLTITATGQIVGGTFDRILKSEPLRLTWTSPNNLDTATFVIDVLVDGVVVDSASQSASAPAGADMSVSFSMPAFLVIVPGKTTDTSIQFRISSTAATAGPTTITGQADGGIVNLSVFKTDGSLS